MEFNIKEHSWIAKMAAKRLRCNAVAIVIGRTVHLHNVSRDQFLQQEKWVKHEGCHIRQFQRHGRYVFMLKYLWETLKHGYYNNKYEMEARAAEDV
jgi:hypothetical protein